MYNSLTERKSMVQILRNKKEIFYGEVREIGEEMDRTKHVYCVSELAFLFDSIQPQRRFQYETPEEMFIALITEHNSQVEERKQFKAGIVTVKDPNDSIYRYTNYEDTLTAIREKLCNTLGGYLRVRKADGIRYIDLVTLEDYGVSASQPIQFGRNLLNYVSTRSAVNIATACIPLGAKLETQNVEGLDAYVTIESVNNGKNYVFNQEAIEQFGWIKKPVKFDNVTLPENLIKKGEEWLKSNQYKTLCLELKAVDLAELNANIAPYNVGDMIQAIAEPFGMNTWFPLLEKTTYINASYENDVVLSYLKQLSYTDQANNLNVQLGKEIPEKSSIIRIAQNNASQLIQSASEGNIHIVYDEDGKPKELLIMDTNDINIAQKVWRWNMNGFGYSSTGYNGKYDIAMTMDGKFVADAIAVEGLVVGKNVQMGKDATISWEQVTGTESVANTDNIPTKTSDLENDSDFASTKDIPSNEYITQIAKDTITAAFIKTLQLSVGNEILMGKDATISWENVTGTDDIAEKTDIPKNISDLKNDSEYQTADNVRTIVTGYDYQTGQEVKETIEKYGYQNKSNVQDIISGYDFKTGQEVKTTIEGYGYQTAIDVDSIITNMVTASFIDALSVVAGSVAAENITGTTISGKTISGGKLSQTGTNSYLNIENAEIVGGYTGQENSIDFSNGVSGIHGIAISCEELMQIRTPKLYVGTVKNPEYVYEAYTGTKTIGSTVLTFKNGLLVT